VGVTRQVKFFVSPLKLNEGSV